MSDAAQRADLRTRARETLWGVARRLVHGRAQDEANRLGATVGIDSGYEPGGLHDAFTHAYVSARLTLALGAGLARRLGELNELLGSVAAGEPLEAEMDHHNNAVGRQIAQRLQDGDGRSGHDLARSIRAAIDGGRLRVIERGTLVASRAPRETP